MKNAHLPRSTVRRTSLQGTPICVPYEGFLGALHLPACRSLGAGRGIIDQPAKKILE